MNSVYLNGAWKSEADARVSVFDRSFQLGDGMFETLRIHQGQPLFWMEHWQRWQETAAGLHLSLPLESTQQKWIALELIQKNHVAEGVLRMHLSRGTGSRGYSLRGAETPLLVLSSHPITQDPFGDHLRWALITAAIRWPNADPLSKWKTANRLISILAKAEADAAGAEESLICQSDDWVMEGASSNFFWWNGDRLQTPSLSLGVLPGITRRIVLNLARAHGIVVDEIVTQRRMLAKADGMFSTLSTLGLVSTTRLDDQQVTDHPMTHWLRNAYRKQLTESLHENSHS